MSGFEGLSLNGASGGLQRDLLQSKRGGGAEPQFVGEQQSSDATRELSQSLRSLSRAEGDPGEGFSNALMAALGSVKDKVNDAKHKAEALAAGEHVELHEVFIAAGKSDVAFNMMLEVRNKLLEAWQTISRSG